MTEIPVKPMPSMVKTTQRKVIKKSKNGKNAPALGTGWVVLFTIALSAFALAVTLTLFSVLAPMLKSIELSLVAIRKKLGVKDEGQHQPSKTD